MKPTIKDAYKLMHDGALALAQVEQYGMRVDVAKLDAAIQSTGEEIRSIVADLKRDAVWKVWKRRYGEKASLGSRPQLGEVVFGELGHKSIAKTRKLKRAKVDEASLEMVDLPFVKKWLRCEKLKKLKATYLMGVRKEVVGGFLHPSFNLHLVSTFRSSSDTPNFQNIPIRDEEIGKIIRSCFIPREGHVLVETDYSALEFRVAACFWRDPAMIAYASDPEKDIHRDMAAKCYICKPNQVDKLVRYCGKNKFVFPILYGSYYVECAKNLWASIGEMNLQVGDVPMDEWLESKGIYERGLCDKKKPIPKQSSFERHIKKVERQFNRQFPQFSSGKEDWWEQYRQTGEFELMTGFVCRGVFSRNNLMNTPIQGPAFHLLLWSLIQLVKRMRKKKMRSVVVGQIHDSINGDIHKAELDDYLGMAREIMEDEVREHWDWIIVPLEVEVEVAETNWFEKTEIQLKS